MIGEQKGGGGYEYDSGYKREKPQYKTQVHSQPSLWNAKTFNNPSLGGPSE